MRSLLLCVTLVAVGCSDDPQQSCSDTTCAIGRTYRECVVAGTSHVIYSFGGDSCSCDGNNCNDCAQRVATFCGGTTGGTTGGVIGGLTGGTSGGTSGGTTAGTNGGTTSGTGGTTGGSCKSGGNSCQSFSECCSGTCANQICTSCAATGESCSGSTGCCGGLQCYQGKCGSCRADGTSCNLASDCCSNICHLGSCQACTALGNSCSSSAECCGGANCTGGVCGGPDAVCAQQPAANCGDCCANNHSAGADTLNNLAMMCICKAATCQSTCTDSVCASPAPMALTQNCYDCYTSKCQASSESSCNNNTDCRAYLACANTCPTM